MRFIVSISDDSGKALAKMTGFATLADACASAHAIASQRAGSMLFVSVGLRIPLAGVSCLSGLTATNLESIRSLPELLKDTEKAFTKARADQKASKARWKFLQQNGGYDGPLRQAIWENEALKQLYFSNQFSAVLTLYRSLPKS